MTYSSGQSDSDSVNLGSNPSSPATTSADVSGTCRIHVAPEKSAQAEQTAHTGRTEAGTAKPRPYYGPVGHVYFISNGDEIKIGFSTSPERRRYHLQQSQAGQLEILTTTLGTLRDEYALHARFAASRVRGEWFSKTPELLALIDEIRAIKRPAPIPTLSPFEQTVRAIETWANGRDVWARGTAQNLINALRWRRDKPDDRQAKVTLILATEGMRATVERRRPADWYVQVLRLSTAEEALAIIPEGAQQLTTF